jgi:PPK2 family polyphosphate:nucleotide phosphotransferase
MSKLILSRIDPTNTGKFKSKDDARPETEKNLERMFELLSLMYAQNRYSLLIILQGIDASGKDGTVQNIFSGANPLNTKAYSFKQPSDEELKHDFLWRCHKLAPETGCTAVFNRSYYEEVSTVMVHPEYLQAQNIPSEFLKDANFFKKRYEQINDFEKMLSSRGTVILKFFLHISKQEQKKRLNARLKDPAKNWKFSPQDLKERKLWGRYMNSFEKMIAATNTRHAPWHVIPADHKWYRDYLTSKAIIKSLENLRMSYS